MLKLYNSLTRRKEVFRPLKGKVVRMYNCGPTVYDYVHIGNLRSFLFVDVLRRYLEYLPAGKAGRGYKVKQVMNITDVGHMTTDADAGEDKMSVAMQREGKGPLEVARFYEEKFFEDVDALGIKSAWKYPRATEHIKEMIGIVQKLLKRGHAYLVPEVAPPLTPPRQGGETNQFPPLPADFPPCPRGDKGGWEGGVGAYSVYYDLSTFPNYGKLSGNKVEDLIAGARVEVAAGKRNPYDFALWVYKPKHVLQWPAPWGAGYPGWHLECSAMSMKYLGATLDIHTGGEDNKFPHHECEIAQSEGATGKPFVRFWLHAKHLLVDGKKMSKSLGNFYTLRDLIAKEYTAREIRYVLISTHYRESLNFTLDSLEAARSALSRVDELVDKLHDNRSAKLQLRSSDTKVSHYITTARRDFIAAMDDDLNVSKALAVVFKFVRVMNEMIAGRQGLRHSGGLASVYRDAFAFLHAVDEVLGLQFFAHKKATIPTEVAALAQKREAARKSKDWKQADELRKTILEMGYGVEDTATGPRVKRSSD